MNIPGLLPESESLYPGSSGDITPLISHLLEPSGKAPERKDDNNNRQVPAELKARHQDLIIDAATIWREWEGRQLAVK